jgi:hypothetical protein
LKKSLLRRRKRKNLRKISLRMISPRRINLKMRLLVRIKKPRRKRKNRLLRLLLVRNHTLMRLKERYWKEKRL